MSAARSTYHHGDLPTTLRQAVVAIVSEQGLGAVTMAACAKRAGVSAGAPYRHFASLDDLLVATAESSYARWNERRRRHPINTGDPWSAMTQLHADFFAFARDEPGEFTLIFDSGLQLRSGVVGELTRDDYEQFVDVVAAISHAPRHRCGPPALGIVALVLGHARMSLGGFSRLSLEQAADLSLEAIHDLLRGFSATASPPPADRPTPLETPRAHH